jgi:hypothetical protein
MHQHHQLDISVTGNGELQIKVHYRGQVPNLLARFSDEVRARAMRFVWWKTRYERRLLRASRHMPDWARATIRQHILHERAVRIEAKLKVEAEKRRLKEQQRSAKIVATQRVTAPEPVRERRSEKAPATPEKVPEKRAVEPERAPPAPPAPAKAIPRIPLPERDPEQAVWAAPMRQLPTPSLTQQFATATGAWTAIPKPDPDRGRGR